MSQNGQKKPRGRRPKTTEGIQTLNGEGINLRLNKLFERIELDDIIGYTIPGDSIDYIGDLTGGKKISVKIAKEIAGKLRCMADAVNQQVTETLDKRRVDAERDTLKKLLGELTGKYVLCPARGQMGVTEYLIPATVQFDDRHVNINGVKVIADRGHFPSFGYFQRHIPLQDITYTHDYSSSTLTIENREYVLREFGARQISDEILKQWEVLETIHGLFKKTIEHRKTTRSRKKAKNAK